ncbi:hypothetical protein C8R47DRAFT_753693 [Mycena vitilis]|nr:hypothetical protein C8R47DRAFT_753693 [Mycena vitilis]
MSKKSQDCALCGRRSQEGHGLTPRLLPSHCDSTRQLLAKLCQNFSMSTLYVPLAQDLAASVLAALSVPGTPLDPSLSELKARLTSALSGSPADAPQASHLPTPPNAPAARPLGLQTRISPIETRPQRRTPQRRASSVPLLGKDIWEGDSGLEESAALRPYISPLRWPEISPTHLPSKRAHPLDASDASVTSSSLEQAPPKRPRVRLILGPRPRTPAASEDSDDSDDSDSDSHRDSDDSEPEDTTGSTPARAAASRTKGKKKKKNPCPRKGAAARVGGDKDIGRVNCPSGTCDDCDAHQNSGAPGADDAEGGEDREEQEGKVVETSKKGKNKDLGWIVNPNGGPPLTLKAGHVLARLLAIFTTANRRDLEDLLTSLPSAQPVMTFSLDGAVERVKQLHVTVRQHELSYMLALIQLSLHVDSAKKEAVLQGLPKVTGEALVSRFSSKVPRKTFLDWLSCGQKLMVTAAAGTMYILPIIAALDMRTVLTRQCNEADIISVACALREVRHGQWLPLVRRLMVPINQLYRTPSTLFSFVLYHNIPKSESPPEMKVYSFRDKEELDQVFSAVETHYPVLPDRSAEWNSPNISPWLPYPSSAPLASHTIKTPLIFEKTKSVPFKASKRDLWTDKERKFASEAPIATSIADLESKLNSIHESGKRKPKQYVKMNTGFLNGKPLFIRDANGKLLSLALVVPPHIKKALEDAVLLIQAAMPGEFRDQDSRNALHISVSQLSLHLVRQIR